MEEFVYILFGEEAVYYYDAGILIRSVKDNEFDHTFEVHKLPKLIPPLKAFELVNGWSDYTQITKEEYEQLNGMV